MRSLLSSLLPYKHMTLLEIFNRRINQIRHVRGYCPRILLPTMPERCTNTRKALGSGSSKVKFSNIGGKSQTLFSGFMESQGVARQFSAPLLYSVLKPRIPVLPSPCSYTSSLISTTRISNHLMTWRAHLLFSFIISIVRLARIWIYSSSLTKMELNN